MFVFGLLSQNGGVLGLVLDAARVADRRRRLTHGSLSAGKVNTVSAATLSSTSAATLGHIVILGYPIRSIAEWG